MTDMTRREALRHAASPLALVIVGSTSAIATPRDSSPPHIHTVGELDLVAIALAEEIGRASTLERAAGTMARKGQHIEAERTMRLVAECERDTAEYKVKLVSLMRSRRFAAVRYDDWLFVDGSGPLLGMDTTGLIVVMVDV